MATTTPESRMSFILLTSSRPLYPLYLPATPCSRHAWESVSFLKFSKHMEQITKSVFQFCPWTWCMCWMTVWYLFLLLFVSTFLNAERNRRPHKHLYAVKYCCSLLSMSSELFSKVICLYKSAFLEIYCFLCLRCNSWIKWLNYLFSKPTSLAKACWWAIHLVELCWSHLKPAGQ